MKIEAERDDHDQPWSLLRIMDKFMLAPVLVFLISSSVVSVVLVGETVGIAYLLMFFMPAVTVSAAVVAGAMIAVTALYCFIRIIAKINAHERNEMYQESRSEPILVFPKKMWRRPPKDGPRL